MALASAFCGAKAPLPNSLNLMALTPYIGVEWSKNFGNTEDFNPVDDVYMVLGLRAWF